MNKIYRTVIIDDEESAIDNLCLALKPYGQIVVEGVAHNGAAGLKLIEKVRPDLVFQDVELPDMLGMELVTRARKKLGVNYNPQIQISAESETKRSIFREKDKTKRSKKESAQHSKSRNKSFVMTSVSAL